MSLDICLSENVCEKCGRGDEVYSTNITHNLNKMAKAAGIYRCLWRPDENGIDYAKEIIESLKSAISRMENRPDIYKEYNAQNGWGIYDDFLPWLKQLLVACEAHPYARIIVSR